MAQDILIARLRPWAAIYYSTLFLLVVTPLVWLTIHVVRTEAEGSAVPALGFAIVALILGAKYLFAGASILINTLLFRRRGLYVSDRRIIFLGSTFFSIDIHEIYSVVGVDWVWRGKQGVNIKINFGEDRERTIYTNILDDDPFQLLATVRKMVGGRSVS